MIQKTLFSIDKDKDAFQIWVRLRFFGEDEPLRFSHDTGMDISEANRIAQCKEYDLCAQSIEAFVEEIYERHQLLFPIAQRSYHEEWEKISQIFYSKVEALTEVPWAFPKYRVILSAFHRGISNRNDNVVFRWIFDNPKDHSRITAHEILMIHMWKVFERIFGERTVAKNEDFFWGANEITTVAILGLEQDMNMLWSENQQGFDRFLSDYSQLSDLKRQLEQKYRNKISFREYVEGLQEFF